MESFFFYIADIHMLYALPEEYTPENRAISLSKAAVIAMKDKAALEGITLASYNWDIAKLDPQDVKKTAVVKISDRSLTMMQYMAADFGSVIGFIANYVNSQFDKAYTDGANALIQTGTDETVAADGNLLVFTVYDYHICLTLIRADGSWETGLIMSDWNVLNSFNEDYVRAALGQFYVTDVEILSVK